MLLEDVNAWKCISVSSLASHEYMRPEYDVGVTFAWAFWALERETVTSSGERESPNVNLPRPGTHSIVIVSFSC